MTVPTTRRTEGPGTVNGNPRTSAAPTSTRQGPNTRGARLSPASRVATPVRGRRRPTLIVAGGLLVILPALGAAWFFNSSRDAHSVLVMAKTVQAGEVIEREDLTAAALPDDTNLPNIASTASDSVIGQRAATDLPRGAVLNESSTVAEVVPAADRAVVGVLLTPAQMPEDTLRPGDTVRLVDVPNNDANLSQDTPASADGVIVSVGAADANGAVVINVDIEAGRAPLLAAHAAIGRVAVVLDTRER